jgi:TonB dependent receptor/Carboxypeptidase regulatory-like domain/TonB-dependent Receptor Plug Domain
MTGAPNRHADYVFVLRWIIAAIATLLPSIPPAFSATVRAAGVAAAEQAGTVHGIVVDAATGAPLSRVQVTQDGDGGGKSTVTGSDGRFELELPPGPRRLRVSVVGYAIATREVTVPAGGVVEVAIALAGGTGTHNEEVTVTAGRFRSADPGAPSQQVLGAADIQNLRGVLADDPLRAVQALPGVATGDDLRSEFTVRGSNFTHLHLTVDGFSTPYLLHSIRGVEDQSSSGSIAMINSDILQEIALVNGGYQQRSGNRTGASVEFGVRPGGRERPMIRAAVSGTSASVVAEGALGRARRGAWLVSARQSYLDLLIERLVDDQVQFGFSDAQAKFVYDVTPSQRVELSMLAGRSRLKEPPEDVDDNDLYVGDNASAVGIAKWQWSGARTVVSGGVLAGLNRFRNETKRGDELDRGREHQFTFRLDARRQMSPVLELEAGAEADVLDESRHRQRPVTATAYEVVNDYAGDAMRTGAYASARWTAHRALTLLPGVRADYWTLTRQTTASPWLQVEWRLGERTIVRGATGLYQQFPQFEQVIGAWGTPGLDRERALHADLAVEQLLGDSARLQVAVYDREERGMLRRAGAETRVVDGRLVRGSRTARYENRLDGHSRGLEVMLRRVDSSAFSGWISYSYGHHRYHDSVSGEAFWGDLDQRHTMNLYGLYRLSPRTSVTAKLRMGSNFPVPGYYEGTGGRYFISDTRNDVRLPSFARLDMRANQTFAWSARRLTLFVEVINVLNRENVRYHPPSIDSRTFETRRLFESLLPVVPSAGILIEF